MKTIKFRVWDGDFFLTKEENMYVSSYGEVLNDEMDTNEEYVIQQYIGIKDKNGKKIYEGDILKGSWNTILEVFYDTDFLQFRGKNKGYASKELDYFGLSKLEIIGNIYENPELII